MNKIIIFFTALISAVCPSTISREHGTLGIAGGQNTSIVNFPYIVSIQLAETHTCSGIILNSRNVMTSASCFDEIDDFMLKFMSVIAGATDIEKEGIKVGISNFFIHEKHDNRKIINDVVIVELDRELPFSEKIASAILTNEEDDPAVGTIVNASGYGPDTFQIYPKPSPLRYAELKIVDHVECENIWRPHNIIVHNQLLCAGNSETNVCYGDAGSPLTQNGILIGFPSLVACGEERPSLFTKVSSIRSWIKEKTGV